jgi:hypothetical protein
MNKDVMEFIVYMIHACSKKWLKSPSIVYQMLSNKNCINGYLIPHYEVLHTQSTQYVVEDIEKFIGSNGDSI